MGGQDGANYEIVIRGRLGQAMTRWFRDLEVEASGPDETYLVGWFEDQAALLGFLSEVGDLGLELAGVRRLPEEQ